MPLRHHGMRFLSDGSFPRLFKTRYDEFIFNASSAFRNYMQITRFVLLFERPYNISRTSVFQNIFARIDLTVVVGGCEFYEKVVEAIAASCLA